MKAKRTKHEIRCKFRDMHDLLIPAHTPVTWREGGQGGWSVEPYAVKVLSDTAALFKHDTTYYFIWVKEQDLEEIPVRTNEEIDVQVEADLREQGYDVDFLKGKS